MYFDGFAGDGGDVVLEVDLVGAELGGVVAAGELFELLFGVVEGVEGVVDGLVVAGGDGVELCVEAIGAAEGVAGLDQAAEEAEVVGEAPGLGPSGFALEGGGSDMREAGGILAGAGGFAHRIAGLGEGLVDGLPGLLVECLKFIGRGVRDGVELGVELLAEPGNHVKGGADVVGGVAVQIIEGVLGGGDVVEHGFEEFESCRGELVLGLEFIGEVVLALGDLMGELVGLSFEADSLLEAGQALDAAELGGLTFEGGGLVVEARGLGQVLAVQGLAFGDGLAQLVASLAEFDDLLPGPVALGDEHGSLFGGVEGLSRVGLGEEAHRGVNAAVDDKSFVAMSGFDDLGLGQAHGGEFAVRGGGEQGAGGLLAGFTIADLGEVADDIVELATPGVEGLERSVVGVLVFGAGVGGGFDGNGEGGDGGLADVEAGLGNHGLDLRAALGGLIFAAGEEKGGGAKEAGESKMFRNLHGVDSHGNGQGANQ